MLPQTFKLRVTVARAVVRSARSVRLCTDVELLSGRRRSVVGGSGSGGGEASTEPLLVVGNGRAYTVADAEPRNAIMGVINKTQQDRKARLHGERALLWTGFPPRPLHPSSGC